MEGRGEVPPGQDWDRLIILLFKSVKTKPNYTSSQMNRYSPPPPPQPPCLCLTQRIARHSTARHEDGTETSRISLCVPLHACYFA